MQKILIYKEKNEKNIIENREFLAPYILSSIVTNIKRVIFIGSNMHPQGVIDIKNLNLNNGIDYA